ncbi:MAG: hypothetical protein EOP04_30635 [Proteobacteria bacterium]|nr:MAG: hypothetical protein EOP04_30635 [Pseudomonadota bacterium]
MRSWLWRDSINAIQFFIKANGTIEKRTALASEYIWGKKPQTGHYTFKTDNSLAIQWDDNGAENIHVKFLNSNAEFEFANQKHKPNESLLFLRIVDEVIVSD